MCSTLQNPYRPREAGYFVPPQPDKWMEPMRGRAKRCFVAQESGLMYVTDYDAGLYSTRGTVSSNRRKL